MRIDEGRKRETAGYNPEVSRKTYSLDSPGGCSSGLSNLRADLVRIHMNMSILVAVLARRNLHVAPEDAAEVVRVSEAAFVGDLLDGHAGVQQVLAAFTDAPPLYGFC
jgi:hypothetical protein